MALVLEVFKNSLSQSIAEVLNARNSQTNEDETPAQAIQNIAESLAGAIAEAVDAYIKTAEVVVGPANILVTSTAPGTPAAVTSLSPAKIQ